MNKNKYKFDVMRCYPCGNLYLFCCSSLPCIWWSDLSWRWWWIQKWGKRVFLAEGWLHTAAESCFLFFLFCFVQFFFLPFIKCSSSPQLAVLRVKWCYVVNANSNSHSNFPQPIEILTSTICFCCCWFVFHVFQRVSWTYIAYQFLYILIKLT